MDFSARAAKHGNKSSKIRAIERAGAVAGKLYAKPYHSQFAERSKSKVFEFYIYILG